MTTAPVQTAAPFDVERIRAQFPILRTSVHGRPLVYLDNAATTQKPEPVIEAVRRYYEQENANIHRGVHWLSERATAKYEGARESLRRFINASSTQELVFVRGATEGINLLAQSYLRPRLKAGDEILISAMEHHSNIVPWQLLREQTGAVLRIIEMNDEGELREESFRELLTARTKLVAVTHVSNALGTVNPVGAMIAAAHAAGVPVLLDGAQAVPHLRVDVQELGADFYVFSGHKMFGPTGVGVLYGNKKLLEQCLPYQGGGDMIRSVTFERTEFNDLPYRLEAGTPHIEGGIALGVAAEYLMSLDWSAVQAHEDALLRYAEEQLSAVGGLRLIGTARNKTGVVSFVLDDVHPHDIGTILDQEGVAIRTGHHCAQPVMQRFGIPATARASIAFYNSKEDIDALVRGIGTVRKVFGV